jgi:hypothetical protein
MSIVERIVDIASDGHAINPETDYCKCNASCELQTGHEFCFVSLFANELFYSIHQNKPEAKYFEWVYIPNLRAENIVGYDLSVGQYETNRRIRTMNKLLMKPWCDQDMTWNLAINGQDKRHFDILYKDFQNNKGEIKYFLILHSCYCIHEYRRMGDKVVLDDNTFIIPAINSFFRTTILPLNDSFQKIQDEKLDIQDVNLTYQKRIPNLQDDISSEDWNSLMNNKTIHSCTIDNLQDEIDIMQFDDWKNTCTDFLSSEQGEE